VLNHYFNSHYQAKFCLLISHDYKLEYEDQFHELYEKNCGYCKYDEDFYSCLVSASFYPALY